MTNQTTKSFGVQLKELRERKNKSQKEFAKEVGIARTSLISYENGATSPTLDVAEKIAHALNGKIEIKFK